MNDGVAMLLERMKTHPEEFYSNVNGKWAHIINTYKPYLNKEDFAIFEDGIAKLMQQRFTEEVMEELVDPNQKPRRLPREKVGSIPSGMFGEAIVKAEGGTVSFS